MNEQAMHIVSQMTLEEKAAWCGGKDFWHLQGLERLGLPPMMVSDGPHGLRKQDDKADHLGVNDSIQAVCYPAGCASACCFDPAQLEAMGQALGESCRAEGVGVLLGPAINIKRSPLCGRNFEYLSEDPYLAGKLAASLIRGVQSWGVGTSVKHYACNNQERRRMSVSAQVAQRPLHEIYLAPFELAVKEGKPWTMMCSYNRVNGVYASENRQLLTEILRDKWGFDGFVMSDWGAVSRRVEAVKAGLELEMPGPCPDTTQELIEAVRAGQLDEAVLDQAVARMVSIVLDWRDAQVGEAVFDREAQHQLAARLETRCAVLLKNTGVLPLRRDQKLAYLGGYAQKPRYQGGGSSHINATRVPGALSLAPAGTVYVPGFVDETAQDLDAAVAAAREAEAAVIFAGLPDSFECEGYDRSHMRLPESQNQLIERVAAVQPNTVVVLHCGSPVELPWADRVAAILCLYLGGEGAGEAADALLYGDANPSGHLAETWPLRLEDNPSYLNFPGDEYTVDYAEGIWVGYRYYDKKQMEVRFPFGHGLSYTDFALSNARLSAGRMAEGETVTVSAEVTNTGKAAGAAVVQLYVASGQDQRPVRELQGFAKVDLAPGETKTVTMDLTARSLSYYEPALDDWYAPAGTYTLELGWSSRDLVCSLPLTFETQRLLPLPITRDTAVGQLLHDPRTAALVASYIARGSSFLEDRQESDAAKEAITDEMHRQMIENAPLRQMLHYLQLSPETAAEMLEALGQI